LTFYYPNIIGNFHCSNSTIGKLIIANSKITGKYWFENVTFLGNVIIGSDGARWFKNVEFNLSEIQVRECMRAKKIHEENGNQVEADKHFYLEMKGRRKQKFVLRRFLEWFVADITCKYGTSWERVLEISGLTILLFGGLYWLINKFTEGALSYANGHTISTSWYGLFDSFYYSIVTFTTLGYGDMHPTGILKIPSAIQSILGAIFMALLVAVFARKWMRK